MLDFIKAYYFENARFPGIIIILHQFLIKFALIFYMKLNCSPVSELDDEIQISE